MSEPGFAFKEIDEEGLATLDVLSSAGKLNRWYSDTISPYIKPGNILEVGSGIGNISAIFLAQNIPLFLSDVRSNYFSLLEKRFGSHPSLKKIILLDLVHPEFSVKYSDLLGSFDTLFALNVVEHIEDDLLALSNCHKLLKPGGRLIILVPAYPMLYNRLDRELFHYRRYTGTSLEKVFVKNNFSIIRTFYFNAAGIAGWFVSGKIQKNKTLPKGQVNTYNALVPLFRFLDKVLMNKMGLSVITVGEKAE